MTDQAPDWAAQLRTLAELATGLVAGLSSPDAVPADHAAECRSCPICTTLAVLRGRRPDLSEALADVLGTAAAALRSHARQERSAAEPAQEDDAPAPPPAPVQRIDVA